MATGSSTKSHVTQIPDGQIFLVVLTSSACSCIRYQDNVAMRSQPSITLRQELQSTYMPKTLSLRNWVETYKADMVPFDFECSNRLTKLDSDSLRQVDSVLHSPVRTGYWRSRPSSGRTALG